MRPYTPGGNLGQLVRRREHSRTGRSCRQRTAAAKCGQAATDADALTPGSVPYAWGNSNTPSDLAASRAVGDRGA